MRINPDILRGEETRPASEIVNLSEEELEKKFGGRRVGPALHDGDLGVGVPERRLASKTMLRMRPELLVQPAKPEQPVKQEQQVKPGQLELLGLV